MASLFELAAGVFDGWRDPDTGLRVLRVQPRDSHELPPGWIATPYQQSQPFLDGGRKMLLQASRDGYPVAHGRGYEILDLATGMMEPFRPRRYNDRAFSAMQWSRDASGKACELLDARSNEVTCRICVPDWKVAGGCLLADGVRAVAGFYVGKPYDEPCHTRFYLLAPHQQPELFLQLNGIYGNHLLACPADPDLFSYNAWPTPHRYIEGVTSMASVDGNINYYVPLAKGAVRPGDFWGVRDHYVWTPDGSRIISYLCADPMDIGPAFNHFSCQWWLSALDWRTGEDYCAPYPAGRWGGHMQVSPDSRYIVCCGGPGFDRLYAVAVADLRDGWNEKVICSYPATNPAGEMQPYYPYPFVLPDQSGIIFSAGWPGSDHGIYLAEWPVALT